ncbi:MAG: mandelate racemase/muconate lactonizing enzyme family protein [Gammaproteobacteria bacterium]|nr:mandelate racemase/muconate lactonizing enzyme family protein [Gammaproteobacteria bacterium]MDG1231525.1 mandelate racemase/muconate lactonizing enzyme family protein [Pseudomonadales bacterium]
MNAEIIPLPPVNWGDNIEKETVLLEITNPEGITGLGSAYTGVDRLQEALRLYQQNPAILHTADAEMTIPMSAIDIALWDIRGKEEGQPVSELLGGRKRDRILAYATMDLPMTSAVTGDALERNLRALLDQGFRAIKLSVDDFGHRDDSKSESEWNLCEENLLKAARKIVGTKVQLMLDVYGSDPNWTPDFDWAVKIAKVLAQLDYLWFEEPLTPKAFDDYVRLTQLSNIAIAAGEDFILLKDFQKLSLLKAVNILQPDCTRVGGLTQMQSIRSAASQNNISLIPHGWNTAIGLAADLQFQATLSDDKFCMVEVMPHSVITDLLKHNPFALDNEGKIILPTGPGLGVSLKDEFRP